MAGRTRTPRKPYSLRVRSGLMDRVRAHAESESKSVNETINQLLECGLQTEQSNVMLQEIKRELNEIQQALLKLALR